jgi:hypothetical protein
MLKKSKTAIRGLKGTDAFPGYRNWMIARRKKDC